MIRWFRAAVSSSVQSGRTFGVKAAVSAIFGSEEVTYIPSVAEGVLGSAERGGYRGETPRQPLQRLSTRRVYVVVPSTSGTADASRPQVPLPRPAQGLRWPRDRPARTPRADRGRGLRGVERRRRRR